MDRETFKQARNGLNGFLGAFKDIAQLKPLLDELDNIESELEASRAAKISLGTELAETGDQLNYLKREMKEHQAKVDAANSALDAEIRERRQQLEDELAARKSAVNAELAQLDSEAANTRTAHAAEMRRLVEERAIAEAAHAQATAALQALRAKIG